MTLPDASSNLVLLFPLASALLYTLGNMFIKQALEAGAGILRTSFISNLIMSTVFLPLICWSPGVPDWSQVHWPILAGMAFFTGQVFTILAVRVGDVSVQTPLMGLKVIFVAGFSFILDPNPIPPAVFVAALLAALAVFLISRSRETHFSHMRRAVIYSILACVAFGLTDSVVGSQSRSFGRLPMLLGMMGVVSVLSLGMLPIFRLPLRAMPGSIWKPLCAGATIVGLQALILNLALGKFGRATDINVVFSTRGLFGVLLVWFAGTWFKNRERERAGVKIMRSRLGGALLLVVAIACIL
ncbi:MAG: drug/metabolite transporter (DMT)-like permease [Kiritimatiellia bacterium]